MRIDSPRMRQSWEAMAEIGATEAGGVTRLALSDADAAARDLFVSWCRDAGLEIRVDDLGTIYAWRGGSDPNALPVALGSHLDTVIRGGRFDGALGVLAGLEVMRALNDAAVETRHPIVLIDFTNEEGARFEPAMVASGVLAGAFEADQVRAIRDREGIGFGSELRRIGYWGEENSRLRSAAAYLELHIEQGPILESLGIPVGLVTGIQGIERVNVSFVGEAAHAGPTPMNERHDALAAASRLVLGARDIAVASNGAATVGRMEIDPDVINVIPGQTKLGLDLRHQDVHTLDRMSGSARELSTAIAADESVDVTFEPFWRSNPVVFDPGLLGVLSDVASRLDVKVHRIASGAGHDAKYMAELAPTAMIFVRTIGGRSHYEQELAHWEDCEAGANVLLNAIFCIATDAS